MDLTLYTIKSDITIDLQIIIFVSSSFYIKSKATCSSVSNTKQSCFSLNDKLTCIPGVPDVPAIPCAPRSPYKTDV